MTLRHALLAIAFASTTLWAIDFFPEPKPVFEVPHYCEGIVFDADGVGYVSEGKRIVRFKADGKPETWAVTGAPNGHKVLSNGTHLVCDASRHAVLKLDAKGKIIGTASSECDGRRLRGPNDLTVDLHHGGFYFSDPGGSNIRNLIGTVHYVDKHGKTHLIDDGLAFPNGIALTDDGKRLFLAESQKNRILFYKVRGPGSVGPRQLFARLPRKSKALGQIDNQPDGICFDSEGFLYVAHYGMRRVQVLSKDGKLESSLLGGNLTTSNVAFGGPKRRKLYITGGLGKENGKGGLFVHPDGHPGLDLITPKKVESDE
ncbi:MAG: SMP-30/gluconolactonase/LRE family protein [Planctomycetota bacterium]